MKSHLTKLALALLSVVFLFGCQEQGSEPVGPEGLQFDKKGTGDCAAMPHDLHCHGDDSENPEGPDVLVTYSDGIMTDEPQLATLSTDAATLGVFNCCPSTFFATLDLTPTVTTAPNSLLSLLSPT